MFLILSIGVQRLSCLSIWVCKFHCFVLCGWSSKCASVYCTLLLCCCCIVYRCMHVECGSYLGLVFQLAMVVEGCCYLWFIFIFFKCKTIMYLGLILVYNGLYDCIWIFWFPGNMFFYKKKNFLLIVWCFWLN